MRSQRHRLVIGIPIAVILLFVQGSLTCAQGQSWNFDDDAVGRNAPGFTEARGQWRVVEDTSAPSGSRVLAQKTANVGNVFNVVLVDDTYFREVDVSVRLRAVAGREDQGGGVVWRAKDASNYYVVRYNPLEDNVRLYFVKDGKRRMLKSVSVDLDHQAWHTLGAIMLGDHSPRHVHVYRDGKLVVKWDLENHKPMKGKATRRILGLIDELEAEGLL